MNPAPRFPITGPRESDGLHERDTSGLVVKTGWGAGLMVRRRYLGMLQSLYGGATLGFLPEAWWVYCEASRKWRLCEPAGFEAHHAGDRP